MVSIFIWAIGPTKLPVLRKRGKGGVDKPEVCAKKKKKKGLTSSNPVVLYPRSRREVGTPSTVFLLDVIPSIIPFMRS